MLARVFDLLLLGLVIGLHPQVPKQVFDKPYLVLGLVYLATGQETKSNFLQVVRKSLSLSPSLSLYVSVFSQLRKLHLLLLPDGNALGLPGVLDPAVHSLDLSTVPSFSSSRKMSFFPLLIPPNFFTLKLVKFWCWLLPLQSAKNARLRSRDLNLITPLGFHQRALLGCR